MQRSIVYLSKAARCQLQLFFETPIRRLCSIRDSYNRCYIFNHRIADF